MLTFATFELKLLLFFVVGGGQWWWWWVFVFGWGWGGGGWHCAYLKNLTSGSKGGMIESVSATCTLCTLYSKYDQ